MKKTLAISMIAILYLSPLAALAQKRGAAQTKAGKYEATVIYDAVDEFKQTNYEGSNYKSYNAHYITSLHVQFQSSQSVKAIRHDGTTSIVEPLDPQATGKFTYTHSGEEHQVSNDGYDMHTDIKEEANYSGVLSKAGGIGADFPDTGDEMLNAGAGAGGIGSGFFKRTINREEYVQDPGTSAMQAHKKQAAPEIDADCQDGANTGPLVISGNKDFAQSSETSCAVDFPISRGSFNVTAKVLTLDEMQQDEGTWAGAKSTGSFASGKYTITLTQTLKPKTWNTEIQNGTNTFLETLSFAVILTLAGKTAQLSSPKKSSDFGFLADALLPEDKSRFLLHQSRI